MKAFQSLLACMTVGIIVYTLIVGVNHGWNLLPIFFGEMAAMTWSGQFDFDFACLLILAGSWIAWRHHFSLGGIVLGLAGTIGGTMVVAPYLLFATFQAKGDMGTLFLGEERRTE